MATNNTPSDGNFDVFGRPAEAWSGTSVLIVYEGSDGHLSERIVDDVVFRRTRAGGIIMVGNCTLRGEARSFKLEKIVEIELIAAGRAA